MRAYLNPGDALFYECLNGEIYVGKTELIKYTNRFMNMELMPVCALVYMTGIRRRILRKATGRNISAGLSGWKNKKPD